MPESQVEETPGIYPDAVTEIQAEASPVPESPVEPAPQGGEAPRRTWRSLPNSLWLIPVAFALGLGAGFLLWGRSGPADAAAAQGEAPQITRYDVPVDDDPAYGPAEAAITIIEFSDYECPYCRSWYAEVFPQLMAAYPGQVRLVYRDFPIESIHPNAAPAAAAANCAQEQGAYWEFHELLFSMQLGLNIQAYQQYASQLGLDEQAFAECVESDRHLEEVRADLEYAANLGVRSTPTFFVNGIAVVGAQPFELFKDLIDKELAGEIPK
jgi:protein-disulfide isomerase